MPYNEFGDWRDGLTVERLYTAAAPIYAAMMHDYRNSDVVQLQRDSILHAIALYDACAVERDRLKRRT